ncbi:phosphoadenylyl-sulfate reductase [Hellea sp.]|nr:phosphoadenylyl-sulfate reductase [Hellea sp.]
MQDTHALKTVEALNADWRTQSAMQAITFAAKQKFDGRIAVTSSFGTESAVLLDLVSKVDPTIPVFFIDTGKHFKATLAYRDVLTARFNLKNLVILTPDADDLAAKDPDGILHKSDTDTCCEIRKVTPLDKAIAGVDAWITGRKRYQNADREDMPIFEVGRGHKVKINPLANWNEGDIKAYMTINDLPTHPLAADGYPSIGCEVCTTRVAPGEDARAGRWRGSEKTECGMHITADGKLVRTAGA